MAGEQLFDSEIERAGDMLRAMRDAFEPSAALLAEAAADRVLPDEARLAAAEERLGAMAPDVRTAEAATARLVAGLAAEIAIRRSEFDTRERPTRLERLTGHVSKAAMRRRIEARWRRLGLPGHLAELLRRADLLVGLVKAERDILLAQRTKSEGDLLAFLDGRPYVIGKLRSEIGGAMTRVEASRHTERGVSVFQGFIDALNGRVGTCNVFLHKLMADTEDLLILHQAISEPARQGDEGLSPELFPNLAPEIGRFTEGMLTVRGLDRRRDHADRAFAERFPAEAAGEAAAEARPPKAGLRLPTLPQPRFLRS
ncbi:hypothetical protein QTA58_17170 [Neorhizobium sp. CSC1952]|uniref:hypothetical protein n=1 Tax=Neorhizobium sp. CSC1952 TaxID=2978974 RepID=UPI0025A53A90|nr:hypothetical protein [Rhizobium sp. CSC1952]WJR65947.1 hypothetical protein QTA58_17170 [Rhizobium sp. CSC1952]